MERMEQGVPETQLESEPFITLQPLTVTDGSARHWHSPSLRLIRPQQQTDSWSNMSSGGGTAAINNLRHMIVTPWGLGSVGCAGMMGNEYMAHKLEGVSHARLGGGRSDDPSVAQCDPGDGRLKDQPTGLISSERLYGRQKKKWFGPWYFCITGLLNGLWDQGNTIYSKDTEKKSGSFGLGAAGKQRNDNMKRHQLEGATLKAALGDGSPPGERAREEERTFAKATDGAPSSLSCLQIMPGLRIKSADMKTPVKRENVQTHPREIDTKCYTYWKKGTSLADAAEIRPPVRAAVTGSVGGVLLN
ncbi:hypothetical protein Q8A73_019317 [Channa argus]|nr:hypothetical protein Q8A73_019317 [Channa argus]